MTRPFVSAAVGLALVVVLGALGVACGGDVKRPDGGLGLLPVGAAAPDLVGKNGNGSEVRLSEVRGKAVVVYFYPQDETPGCTKEACAFRDAWKELEASGVTVFGVSANSDERHRAFQKSHGLPFPLVSDESGSTATAYGVRHRIWGHDRVSFLLDREGKVAKVWPDVDPAIHAREVITAASGL